MMTVKQLKEILQNYSDDMEILVLDESCPSSDYLIVTDEEPYENNGRLVLCAF